MYFTTGKFEKMVDRYRSMLNYISSVTRNECTEAINIILDTLATATDMTVLSEMYEITLLALKASNNERLWFNTNLKLAKVYLEEGKLQEVDRLISALKETCKTPEGNDDLSKGTLLLEIYCLEIQLCAVSHNSIRMKQIYPKTMNLNAAVADPRIMGIIREEGGKMQMSEGNWEDAYNELYESFRNYQEAGNSRARDILKYVVVASMLTVSDINPFAAREAKVFSDDKEIVAMSDLRQCLEANDLARFERIIKNKQNKILDEPFLMTYIQPLRRRMREQVYILVVMFSFFLSRKYTSLFVRTAKSHCVYNFIALPTIYIVQVLLNLTRPYKKVTVAFLARELALNVDEVESLLVDMILDQKLSAHIDQIKGHVILEQDSSGVGASGQAGGAGQVQSRSSANAQEALFASINKWADALALTNENFGNKLM